MSLKHIVLGLAEQGCSGYDIKKEFDHSLRNFWRAELSQIYPVLQKLEQQGLLESEDAESELGPRRRVYHRTPEGGEELRQWLADGPMIGTERIAFLAQVFFLHELESKQERLAFMHQLKDYFTERFEFLQGVEEYWKGQIPGYPDDMPDEEFFPQLTLSCGKHRIRATLAWCDETIERLEKR